LSTSNIGIAIAAPSGRPLDIAAYNLGVQRLQQQGYLVHNYYDDDKKFQRFGGTDEWRLAQLNAAAADPASAGGDCAARLVRHVAPAAVDRLPEDGRQRQAVRRLQRLSPPSRCR
jgi:muramoyltetrapeptide carboxypeptidase LdcA involved in peptidoglycan recycling